MSGARPEVADVVRMHGEAFLDEFGLCTSSHQRRVLRALATCGTATLGGHKWRCEECDHEEISYNSCRDRHCPKCQGAARAAWLDAQREFLLEVPYFHTVFTLPDALRPLALQNKRLIYGLLFQATSQTLMTIAGDPLHLGAQIGFLAILHTWGQHLGHHPHIHCVVPGGGVSSDQSRWISCPEGFFLPVRVLSRQFRATFLRLLDQAHTRHQLVLHGRLAHLSNVAAWESFLDSLRDVEWVVYCKPPFGGANQVLKYLARYTHRVAISNQRILNIDDDAVTFSWKDYAHGNRRRNMTLKATEFLRRLLLHVLPKGFQRIRYFGFLAHRVRREKLERCRQLMESTSPPDDGRQQASRSPEEKLPRLCPVCKRSHMRRVGSVRPQEQDFIMSCTIKDTS